MKNISFQRYFPATIESSLFATFQRLNYILIELAVHLQLIVIHHIMFMMKLFKLLSLILLVLFFLVLIASKNTNLRYNYQKVDEYPQFSVTSEFDAYKLDSNSLDHAYLDEILNQLSFSKSWTSFRLLQDTNRINPSKVIFMFSDLSKQTPQQQQQHVHKFSTNQGVYKSYFSNYNEDTQELYFYIYYTPEYLESKSTEVNRIWEHDVFLILYATSLSEKPFDIKDLYTLKNVLNTDYRELIRVKVNSISQVFKELMNVFSFRVYAVCNGYFTCGTLTYSCEDPACPPDSNNNRICDDVDNTCTENPNISCSCGYTCSGDVAKSCSLQGNSNACNDPTPGCYPLCLTSSSCSWSGAPNPSTTPTPQPSGPPSGSGTTCPRCVNPVSCQVTTSNEPCGCEACVQEKSKKAVFLFDDSISENGVWEPHLGEKRITGNASCASNPNVMYLENAAFVVQQNTYVDSCNVGNSEYSGPVCTGSISSCNGGSGCSTWGWEWQDIQATCFTDDLSCSESCHWILPQCNSAVEESGLLCRSGSYCNPSSPTYMKTGPYNLITKNTGTYSVGAQFPPGWKPSSVVPQQATWSNTTGACDGILGYGLVPNREKWCRVSLSSSTMSTTGSPITATITAMSTEDPETAKLVLVSKQPAPATAPTNIQLANPPGSTSYVVPTGTTHEVSNGRHYYHYTTNCVTGNSSTCTRQVAISNLPAGEYYVFCSVNADNGLRCTGNPNCTHEGLGGSVTCTGQQSCSTGNPDDNATLQVTCPAPSACVPACGQNNGCNVSCGNSDDGGPPVPNLMASQNITVTTPGINQSSHYATITWTAGTSNTYPTTRYDLVVAPQNTLNTATDANAAFDYCASAQGCGNFASTCNVNYSFQGNSIPIRCIKHVNVSSLSHNYSPISASIGNEISVFARAVNFTCTAYTQGYFSAFSSRRDYNLVQTISGNFYQDGGASGSSTTMCVQPGEPISTALPGPNSTLTITPPGTGSPITQNVSNAVGFSIPDVPYNPTTWTGSKISVELDIDNQNNAPDAQLVCACPDGSNGCTYTNISSPQSNIDFFLTTIDLSAEAWWQTVNGLLYAAQDTIISLIPDRCKDGTSDNPNCIPYLITQDKTIGNDAFLELSAGIPMSGAGDVAGTAQTVWLTERTPQARTSEATTHTQLTEENFAYFQSRVDYASLDALPSINGTVVGMPALASDEKKILKHTGNLTIRPGSSPWRVSAGQSLIIFVEGDITFQGDFTTSDPLTQVEEGGFLAFIADGHITFDENVGNISPADLNPAVSGLFVADKTITVAAASDDDIKDKHFVGAGTFVAWAEDGGVGVSINRDYTDGGTGGLDNHSYPTDTFIFRPDLVNYLPDELKSTNVFWQEVN